MDGFLLLILSWIVIGLISYFLVNTFMGSGGTSSRRRTLLISNGSQWFNEAILWMSTSPRLSSTLMQFMVHSLNDASKKLPKINECEVHFSPLSVSYKNSVPIFEQIKAQQAVANADHLIINSQISMSKLNLKLAVSKLLPDGNMLVVSNPTILVKHIFGDVETRLAYINDELFVMSCFCGRPDMTIEIQDHNSQQESGKVTSVEPAALEDFVRKTLVSAVLNFSLSEFLYSSSDSTRNSRLSADFRNLSLLNEHYPPPPLQDNIADYLPPNKIQVRLLRAQNLAPKKDIHNPYICAEIDEPSQKFMTAKAFEQAKDGSPIWNETLEFTINPASNEILFEVYDDDFPLSGTMNNTKQEKPIDAQEKRFLGLAIVGLDELKTGSVHQLKLQGKPYGNANSAEKVSGSIVVECRFLHIASSLPRQPNSLTSPSMRPNPTHNQPRFPVSSLDNRQKGSLTNFQPNYLYNIGGAGDESLNHSPSPPPPLKSTSVIITNPGQAQQSPRRHQQFSYGPQGYGFGDFDDPERIAQRSPSSNQQFEELNSTNSYDRQMSPSTNSQHSQLHQQVNNFHTQPTRENVMADELYNPYVIDRQQQQYSLERAAKQPRMVNERPNTSRSYDEYTAQNVLTYDQQKEPLVIDTGTTVPVNSPQSPEPPPVPPHAQQTGSALEETARRARDREPKKPQSKHRERSFFEELRQRLTRGSSKLGRKRAKSLDQQNPELEEAVSVPPSRDQSQTRYPTGQKDSIPHHHEVSSTAGSDWRGPTSPSSASTSQLILELDDSSSPETDGKRYYLIPGAIANEPAAIRLMRSGKKLHVHNSHAFVAVKPRGRVMCNVCGRNIAGNFTKQAYQCRDCRKVSHKSCHQRSSSPCHNSNLANLNIIEDVDWVDFLRQYQFEEFISVNGV